MSDTRRSMFKKLAGAAAALVGIKSVPEVISIKRTFHRYWPPILKTVQVFPQADLDKWFAADAERITGLLQKRYDDGGPGILAPDYRFPEGMGYNWSTIDKHEA